MGKEITVKFFYVKATIDEKLDKIVYLKKKYKSVLSSRLLRNVFGEKDSICVFGNLKYHVAFRLRPKYCQNRIGAYGVLVIL